MDRMIATGALLLGLVTSGLGMWGAFEFAYKLEGAVTYITLATPVVAGAAAIIPVLAESSFRTGAHFRGLLWVLALVPAAAVVFFSAAERLHVLKAGAAAERTAARQAAYRAVDTLTKAETAFTVAQADANKARGQQQCGSDCRTKLATEVTAQAALEAAKQELQKLQKLATEEPPIQAPVWLLPAALDVVAFLAIWHGLSGLASAAQKRVLRTRRRRVRRIPKAVVGGGRKVVPLR